VEEKIHRPTRKREKKNLDNPTSDLKTKESMNIPEFLFEEN
jgi:hypothetical protein